MKILWGHSRKTLVLQGGLRGNLVKEMGIEAELGKLKGAVRAHRVSQERMQRTALPTWPLVFLEDIRAWNPCVCHRVRPTCWRKRRRYFKSFPSFVSSALLLNLPEVSMSSSQSTDIMSIFLGGKAPSSLGWAPTLARQHLQLLDSCLTNSQQGQSGDENINDFLSLMQSEDRYSSDITTFSSKQWHSFSRCTECFMIYKDRICFDSCHIIFPSHFRGKDIEGLIC